MTRPGKMAGVLALLAALLLGSPVLAQDKGKKSTDTPQTPEERAKEFEERLKKAEDEIARLRREAAAASARTASDLAEIKEMLRSDRTARRSFSIDPERRTTTEYGSIRLDNRLDVTAFVTIDGRTYAVAPFETRTLRDVVAGPLMYTVSATSFPGTTIRRTRVYPNDTLNLKISD